MDRRRIYEIIAIFCCVLIISLLIYILVGVISKSNNSNSISTVNEPYSPTIAAGSDTNTKINELFEEFKRTKKSMEDERDRIYKAHADSIDSANRIYSVFYLFLTALGIFMTVLFSGGIFGLLKLRDSMEASMNKYIQETQEEGKDKITQWLGQEIKSAQQKIDTEREQSVERITDHSKMLAAEFENMKRKMDYQNHLLDLSSSEDIQLKALNYFINYFESNPHLPADRRVIEALKKLDYSPNSLLRAYALAARHVCKDASALPELKRMSQNKTDDLRNAAIEALKEIGEA